MTAEHKQFDLALKGNAVLPNRIVYDAWIGIKDGRIEAILKDIPDLDSIHAVKRVDYSNQFIMPGAIDAHVHCFSSLDEGFTNAGRAAAAGGVTTIIEMPYDATGIVCTEQLMLDKINRLEQESIVDTALLVTIAKEGSLDEIPKLAAVGACGFKVSMFNTDSVRFPRIDDARLLDAFSAIAETSRPVGVHAENDEIVRSYISKMEEMGEKDPRSHAWSRPKAAEGAAAVMAMELAYHTGVKLHLYHTTYEHLFRMVQYYRSQGAQITAETCTHYLTLTEDDMLTLGAKAKINPPLRSADDVEALWNLAASGGIDMITSDHAPWTMERKMNANIFKNSSGAPGVENLLPVLYSEGVAKGRITILDLVRMLSEKPAATFGLDYCKGKIAVGLDADLVILDPIQSYHLDEKSLHSSAKWSPYHNRIMQGKVVSTYVRGHQVYDGQVIGTPGAGRYVKAKHL
jgi:allantoinase